MEVNVKVTHELGEKTLQLLTGGLFAAQPAPKPVKEVATPAKEEKAPAKEEKAAPKASSKKADDFDSLDDDAKLEAIKTEVTKNTKKGKSADIKALLAHFDAARASELAAESYNDFYQALKRYNVGAGESIAAITGGGDDDLA